MANRKRFSFSTALHGRYNHITRNQNPLAVWIIIAALLIQQSAFAQFSITPSRTENSIDSVLPEAGSVIVDSDSDAKIVRVTDSRDGQATLATRVNNSSFNRNSSRFLVNLSGVTNLYDFNSSSLELNKLGPLFNSVAVDHDSLHWSSTETNTIIGLESADAARIFSYDTESGTYAILKDFSDILPNGEVQGLSKSRNDDNHFSFSWRERGSSWRFVVVWERSADSIHMFDLADAIAGVPGFTSANLDRSGEALMVIGDIKRVWRYRNSPQWESVQLESEAASAIEAESTETGPVDVPASVNRPLNISRNDVSPDGRFSICVSPTGATRSDVFIASVNAAETASSIIWANLVNCSADANTLEKTGGTNQVDDAHATSIQAIQSGDAHVEFTAEQADKERWCGLSNSNAIHEAASDINFGIRLGANKKAFVVENGIVKTKIKYKRNNVFRVAVESGVVNYYKNGSLFYTSIASPSYPLLVNASLIDAMASVSNAVVSSSSLGIVVSISPPKASLTAGSTRQFTALVTGSKDTISWSATGGQISNTGLYTAPATAGNFVVRAACASNLSISASASVSVSSSADTTRPVISAVNAAGATAGGVTINWTTNEPSDTQVEYGATTGYGSSTALNASMVTAHSAFLSGLSASTTYQYRVKSRDAAGNLAVSGNFSFATSAAAPPPPPPPPSSGMVTDKNVYPVPAPPALPRAGGTFVDPTFRTTIMRVTDENDGASNHNYYSYWPTFNLDSTRFFIASNGSPKLYRFDPNNFQIISKGPLFDQQLPGGGFMSTEDAMWSGTNPNVLLGYSGLKLWAFDVAARTYTLIKDFTGELPAGHLGQMSKSADDNMFAFTRKDPNWSVTGYVVWRRDQNRTLRNVSLSGYDEVQVDKSGRYLTVKANFGGGADFQVVDLETGAVQNLTDSAPDYSPGHSDNGRLIVVGHDNWANRYTVRNLATPHQFQPVISFGSDWSQANHLSMLGNDDRWCLISNFTNGSGPVGPFRQEIFQASTDGSQSVRRLAHHHSVYRDYWDTPRANISPDGRFVAFTSNWGSASRRDVFIVRVPQGSGSSPAPTDTTPPVISSVATSSVTSSSATISWTTNESSDTQVEYGTTVGYGSASALNTSMSTSHGATLSGLSANTLYHYRVRSRDAAGNLGVSGDFTFTATSGGSGGGGGGTGSTQNVSWTSVVNCAVSGNSIQKTAGRDDEDDAGAVSQQRLMSGNGYLEFTAGVNGKIRFCGLTSTVSGTEYTAIDFAIKLTEFGYAEVRENNVYRTDTPYSGSDVFRVAVEGGVVKYYKNGAVFYTSSKPPAYPLRVDAVFLNLSGTVNNAVINAGAGGQLATASQLRSNEFIRSDFTANKFATTKDSRIYDVSRRNAVMQIAPKPFWVEVGRAAMERIILSYASRWVSHTS